jgi:hypothetical protein
MCLQSLVLTRTFNENEVQNKLEEEVPDDDHAHSGRSTRIAASDSAVADDDGTETKQKEHSVQYLSPNSSLRRHGVPAAESEPRRKETSLVFHNGNTGKSAINPLWTLKENGHVRHTKDKTNRFLSRCERNRFSRSSSFRCCLEHRSRSWPARCQHGNCVR